MSDVVSGSELNSYRGDANLAGGSENTGYSKIDFSPLQTYALQRYNTHLIDYQQQVKDRADLEKQFNNPALYVDLDKGLADQISPKFARFKELAKKNLELNPKSDDWYEFKNLSNELIKDNAKAKTVQTTKEKYESLAAASANPDEREKLNKYVKQLEGYKLGDEIPVYNKYFDNVMEHLPAGEPIKTSIVRLTPDGKNKETVEYNASNPMNLDKVAELKYMKNPEVANTYANLGYTLITHGGIETLNAKAKETADLGIRLNSKLLQEKYKNEFAKFSKENPTKTFLDFLGTDSAKMDEYNKIKEGHKFLTGKDGRPAIEVITAPESERTSRLSGYSYSDDGTKRLSKSDIVVGSIYGATNKPVESESVLKVEPAIDPEKQAVLDNQVKIEKLGNASSEKIAAMKEAGDTFRAKLPYEKIKLTAGKDAKTVASTDFNPLASIVSAVGGINKRFPLSSLSVAQIGAINQKFLDKNNQVDSKYKDYEISVGSNKAGAEGSYGIYIYKKGGTKSENDTMVNESALKSNGSSWLATFGKETKGQDAYIYDPTKFTEVINGQEAPQSKAIKTPQSSDFYSNQANSTGIDSDGNFTYSDGTAWKFTNGKMIQIK